MAKMLSGVPAKKGLARRLDEAKKVLIMAGLPGDKVVQAFEEAERRIYGSRQIGCPRAVSAYIGTLFRNEDVRKISINIDREEQSIIIDAGKEVKTFTPENWSLLSTGKKAKRSTLSGHRATSKTRKSGKLHWTQRPENAAKVAAAVKKSWNARKENKEDGLQSDAGQP